MRLLQETVRTGLNFELAAAGDVLGLAEEIAPMAATLVPEKREEVTTEGGVDIGSAEARAPLGEALRRLESRGVRTSRS